MASVKLGQVDEVEFIRADGTKFTAKLKVVGVVGQQADGADQGSAVSTSQEGGDNGRVQTPE